MSLPLYQRTRNTPKVNVSVARNLDILLIPIKKGKYATMIRCLDVISECRNVHRIDRHNLKSMLIPLLLPRLMLSSKCPQNQQSQNSPQTAKCALLCYGDIKEVFVCYDPMKRRIFCLIIWSCLNMNVTFCSCFPLPLLLHFCPFFLLYQNTNS